jgi:hypothetical protein
VPEFCRIEYRTRRGWAIGHAGINLMDPQKYIDKLAKGGTIGRAIAVDTGEIFEPPGWVAPECSCCGSDEHAEGMCLL